jgi:WD40 repeat protein
MNNNNDNEADQNDDNHASINMLAPELLVEILSYLNKRDLAIAGRINSFFYDVSRNSLLVKQAKHAPLDYEAKPTMKIINIPAKINFPITILNDGHFAGVAWYNADISIWDPVTENITQVLKGHSDPVTCMIELFDGCLASASEDATLRIWNRQANTCQVLTGHHHAILSVIELANGHLASSSRDRTIRIWNRDQATCVQILKGHTDGVSRIIQLANGLLASISYDGSLRVWDWSCGTCRVVRSDLHSLYDIASLADSKIAITCICNHTICIWDDTSDTNILIRQRSSDNPIHVTGLATGYLATGSRDGMLRIWDYKSGTCCQELRGHTGSIRKIIELSDANIATISKDNTIRIWTFPALKLTKQQEGSRATHTLKGLHSSRCRLY